MNTLSALRVRIAGTVTSFRYPHFVQGVQPTFDFPPPATLYGHVCSALGDLAPPQSFRLAIHFTHDGRFRDYEHTHMVSGITKLSPSERELLFQPRLTLYLDRPDWVESFRRPRRVVTLGRSQDIMTYYDVRVVELERVASGYVEHTLVPLEQMLSLGSYTALRLPAWIAPERHTVQWGDYAAVHPPQAWPDTAWADTSAPQWRGLPRAVIWLDLAS